MAPKNTKNAKTKNLSVKKLLKTSAVACLAGGLSVAALNSVASAAPAAPTSVSIVVTAGTIGSMAATGNITNGNYVYNNGGVTDNAAFATAWAAAAAALQANPLVLIAGANTNAFTFNALANTLPGFWPSVNVFVNGANATPVNFITPAANGVWKLGAVSKAANTTGSASVTLNASVGAPIAGYDKLPARLSAALTNVGVLVLDGKAATGDVYTTAAAVNAGTPTAMVAGYGALTSLSVTTIGANAGVIEINTTNGITLGTAAAGVSVNATGETNAKGAALVLVSGLGSADGNIYVNAWGTTNPVGLILNADKKLTITGDTANAGAVRNFGTIENGRGIGVTSGGTLEVNLTSIVGDIFTTPGAAQGSFNAPITSTVDGSVYALGGTINFGDEKVATRVTGAVHVVAGNVNIKTGGTNSGNIDRVNLLAAKDSTTPAAITITGNATVVNLSSTKVLPTNIGTAGANLADVVNSTFTGAGTIITNLDLAVGGTVSVKQVNQGTITSGTVTVTDVGAGAITLNGTTVTDAVLNLPNIKAAGAQIAVASGKLGTVNVSGTTDKLENAFAFTDATNKAAIVLNAKGVNILGAITAPAATLNLELAASTTTDKPMTTGALNAKEINVISTAAGFVTLGAITTDVLSFSASNKLVVNGDFGAADKKLAAIKYTNTTASNAAGELNFAGTVYATGIAYDASTAPSTLSFEKALVADGIASTGDKLLTVGLNTDQTTATNFDLANGAIKTSKTVTFTGAFAKPTQFVTSKDAKGKITFDPAAKEPAVLAIKGIGEAAAPYASVNFKKAAKVNSGLYADLVEVEAATFIAVGTVATPAFTVKTDSTVVFVSDSVDSAAFTAAEGKKVDLHIGARSAEDGVLNSTTIKLTGAYGTDKTALNSLTIAKEVKELQLKAKVYATTVAGLSDLKVVVGDKTSAIYGKADMNNAVIAIAGENVITFGGGVKSAATGTLGYEVEIVSATANGQWIVTGEKTEQDLSAVTAFNITVKAPTGLEKGKWSIMTAKDKGVIKFPKKDVIKIASNDDKYKFEFEEGALTLGGVSPDPKPDAPTDVAKVWSNMAGESFAKEEAKYLEYVKTKADAGNETAKLLQAEIEKINGSSATDAEKAKQTAELVAEASTSPSAVAAVAAQSFFNVLGSQMINNSLGQTSAEGLALANNLGASAGDDCDDASWDVQLKPFYNAGNQKNNDAIGYKTNQGGVFLSAGYRFDESAKLGLAIGYTGADIKEKTVSNRKITSNSMLFSIFGSGDVSPEVGITGALVIGSVKSKTPVPGVEKAAKLSFKNTVINALVKADYRAEVLEGHTLNPYLSVGFGNVGSSKATAKMSDKADDKVGIEYNTKAVNWFQGVLGANYYTMIESGDSVMKPGVYANVQFGSKGKVTATEQFIGADTAVNLPTLTGQAFSYSAGASFAAETAKGMQFGINFGFQFAKKYMGWNGMMTLGVAF
ncbi:Autotransporter outer membrane beta-barrel domain-containing protein [Rickettsiales endosymbiont of Paramecium tredecaurelia]|uniref:autotransporter domain-containing protein n=1 Tax=Candidatus Sarmatiella mevalonica TaxID=2770581 RepID=UPI001923C1D4|nr:autotransporter outer membrane beta-barrel domain-containing protein [Candidatus Sarmatiella mevalonica]MBL3284256.1 Autotransporter outer membrane beta-barrel domain-containing protein [Candidatus Sarmatiella mevalonica]